jgi:hypothetical protein
VESRRPVAAAVEVLDACAVRHSQQVTAVIVRRITWEYGESMAPFERRRPMSRGAVLALAAALVAFASAAQAQEEKPAIPALTQVRSLAENVLGAGLIRGVSVTEGGATVLLRWEAATYRPEHKSEYARGQLFGEAELVTGSVMGGVRSVSRIRFSMARKDGQVLASGVNTRGPGVSLNFSQLLGGGSYQSAPSKTPDKPVSSSGSSAAKD